MKKLRLIYLLFLLGLNGIALKAQTSFASEEELKKQAAKLFDDDQFEEAYPLYTQLTSIYPKDPNYNYRIGVCMIYSSEDKELPISYLEFASKKPDVDKEVFFYLAKAYHLNYRFDDAIKTYYAYKKIASGAKAEKLQVDHQIEMCKNGKKLLHNLSDLVVIDKKEMNRTDFFRGYDVSEIGGKLLVKPDEDQFKTPLDKKKKESSIIYLASNNNQIYFSSYGTDPERGKDIFIIRKLPSGDWSPPQTLGYPVNTEYDEDFPFLHPNGKVLYFCSKGHNSMGGYDIFKTTLNEETDTWSKPVNMDFPINTPDDDILYVTNVDEKEAYFASARASATGKTAVYHIKSDRRAIDKAIVKGTLMRNKDDKPFDIKITVKDMKDNSILGIYNSKSDGSYFLSLPNGGKFLYTIEATAFKTQSEVVEIPTQSSFTPLKQEISYEQGTDKLIVKNSFGASTDEDDKGYLAVLNLIKEKSKMEVNVNEISDNPPIDNNTTPGSTASTSTEPKKSTTLNNNDIIKIAYDDAKDAETEAKEAREQADIALNLANQKNELAQSKTDESKKLINEAAAITDNIQKQAILSQANAASKEAELLNDATVVGFNLVKKLEKSAVTKQEEADLSLKYAKDLEAAVKAKNSTDALTRLDDQKQKLETLSQEKTGADDIFSSLKIDSDNKQRELNKAIQISADIKQEMVDNLTLIENVQADADKTKNEQLKKGLLDQIVELKQENIDKQKELEQNDLRVVRLEKEFNGIKNETELVNTVIDRSKTETNETAAASIENVDKTKLEEHVNTIKAEAPATSVASSNTNPPVNTATPESKVTAISASNPTIENAEAFTKVNQKYTDDVAAAEKIENASQREKVKAEVLQQWSSAIDKEVIKQKESFVNATDPETKTLLANSISDAQQLSKEKQTQASESLAKAEELKQQETTIAGTEVKKNSTTSADTITTAAKIPSMVVNEPVAADAMAVAKLGEKYTENLTAAEKIENVVDRESAKAEVLKKWSEEIDVEVNKQKMDFVNATDPETKTLLANSISNAQKLSEEKHTQANESLAKVETYKQSGDSLVSGPIVPAVTPDVATKSVTSGEEKQFVYSSPSSKDQSVQANKLNEEAEDLAAQSNELKAKAESLTDIADKNSTYAQADEINKQAENKKIEAAGIIATANQTEFTNNRLQLEQMAQSNETNMSDDISRAELMKDEAKIYFDKAQKMRSDVAADNPSYAKTTTLDEAYANEMIALEKQNKAVALYKKYGTGNLVANSKTNSNVTLKTTPAPTPIVTATEIPHTTVTETPTTVATETPSTVVTTITTEGVIPVTPVAPNASSDSLTAALDNTVKGSQDKSDTLYLYQNPPLVRDSTTNNPQVKENTIKTPASAPVAITVAPVKTPVEPVTTPIATKTNTESNQPSKIKLSGNEVFERKSKPVYTAASPIPVNIKLPEGLIFKVQIGAFRNPIPQDLFKGMTPITGETTPHGFTRYTAGIFVSYPTADKVKSEIRDLGYKDAFVVAFLNGKRIPINEALVMAGIDPSTIAQTTASTSTANIGAPLVTGNSLSQPLDTEIAPSENVTMVNGLFYTVQVGVYSQQVAASQLYNVQPLYIDRTSNGMIRYNTGIYNNMPRAVEAKDIMVDIGIKDAFVTAFYNGKRVSLSEAALVANQGTNVFTTAPNINSLPVFSQKVETLAPVTNSAPISTNNQPSPTSPPVKPALEQNNAMPVDAGVVFKVQIGAFREEVPIEIANKFLQIASKGIKNYKDENGLTIYTVGTFRNYEDANKAKADVIGGGVTDAFIVAYSDGKKVSIDEAQQLINK